MLDIYETLEIKKVLELISDYSKTEIAHDKILVLFFGVISQQFGVYLLSHQEFDAFRH